MPSTRPNILETLDAAASASSYLRLGVGQTGRGTLSPAGDHDWWGVDLVAGQTYTFAMIGTGITRVGDTLLTLRNATGASLATNDDGGPANSSLLTFTAQSSGTYYLDAGSYNNAGTGQYGISATLGARANFDYSMGAGALDTGAQWTATRGTGTVVTYGFRETAAGYTVSGHNISTFSQLSTVEINAVRQILAAWSEISGITFQEVNPGGYTNNATMLFANYQDASDGAGAFAFYPGDRASGAQAGDVWLNLSSISTTSIPQGSYSYLAIMHEVGHAVGLSHPGDYNAAPGQSITYQNNAQFIQDSGQYSVMSYFGGSETGQNPGGFGSGYTPGVLDILQMQQIYGTNYATRAGDTVYGFNTNAGSTYSFPGPNGIVPRFTIWDGGGTDTIDASGYSQVQLIDLREGFFSNVGGGTQNVAIALNAVIENATGGSGNDTIYGNDVANVIAGGGGTNTLIGGGGDDSYIVSSLTDTVTELSGGGFDTVYANNVDFNMATQSTGLERLVLLSGGRTGTGTESADTLIAYGNSATLNGGGGEDTLYAFGAQDILNGGGGNDTFYLSGMSTRADGGTGNDSFVVRSQNDLVMEGAGQGYDTIYADNTDYSLSLSSTNVEVLVMLSSNRVGAGRDGSDDIIAAYGTNNVLYGGSGNDTLYAFGIADRLDGGDGNDIYVAADRNVFIFDRIGQGSDTLYADNIDFSLSDAPNVENLVIRGNNHVGAGTNGVDLLMSAGISNQLFGGDGNDVFSMTAAHGMTRVLDFNARGTERDAVAFSTTQFANFAQVQSYLTQQGSAAVITAADGSGDTFVLNNVVAANLRASDFLFV